MRKGAMRMMDLVLLLLQLQTYDEYRPSLVRNFYSDNEMKIRLWEANHTNFVALMAHQ